ncbi:ferredoxin [Myroides sp. LJL119]
MIVITLQKDKCIGCNYCVEVAPQQFQMSKKDGKTVLLNSIQKKNFYTLKSTNYQILENCELAQDLCPVKIISVKTI